MGKISFTALGGSNEVGRSSFLVDSGEKILLERGVKLTQKGIEYPLPVQTNLDAAVISHAHLDHSGALPHLFLHSNILSYMTPPTLDIAKMLWFDSLKIAGLEAMQPEFTADEIAKTERFAFPAHYRRKLSVTKNISLEFFDAGHITGSALTKLSLPDAELLYTGDFKVEETRLFKGADLDVGHVDYLIIESTYGDRNHPERKECEKLFIEEVQDTVDRGGTALVPAFAVGRSQEVIDVLYEYKINAPINLDGMGQKAARIMLQYPQFLKNAAFLQKALSSAIWIRNDSARRKALQQPGVIVTTAGMLGGGPVVHYLKKIYKDKNSTVLLTGYQVADTPGRILMETKKFPTNGTTLDVEAKVERFDFSAHASQSEMLKAIEKWKPQKIFLVHGDKEVAAIFKEKIEQQLGIETVMPQPGKQVSMKG